MSIDMFETRALTNAIDKVKVVDPFILNMLWKGKDKYHASDNVDIEITTNADKIAQFVMVDGVPKMIKKGTKDVKTVKIPMTWEKKTFTASELAVYKQVGSIYGNAADIESRANQFVLREIADLKNRVTRRREQMACEALSTGLLTVTQDDFAFTIDFGYTSGTHLVTNGSGAMWNAATPSPSILSQIRTAKSNIMKRSGFSPTIGILGTDAASSFLNSTAVQTALDTLNYRVGSIDLNSPANIYGNYLGRLFGIDWYEYNQVYTSQTGVATDMIAADLAIILTPQLATEMHHGPLFRIEGQNLKVHQVDILVETMTNIDKTYLEWKVNQKSLPSINDPDGLVVINVQ